MRVAKEQYLWEASWTVDKFRSAKVAADSIHQGLADIEQEVDEDRFKDSCAKFREFAEAVACCRMALRHFDAASHYRSVTPPIRDLIDKVRSELPNFEQELFSDFPSLNKATCQEINKALTKINEGRQEQPKLRTYRVTGKFSGRKAFLHYVSQVGNPGHHPVRWSTPQDAENRQKFWACVRPAFAKLAEPVLEIIDTLRDEVVAEYWRQLDWANREDEFYRAIFGEQKEAARSAASSSPQQICDKENLDQVQTLEHTRETLRNLGLVVIVEPEREIEGFFSDYQDSRKGYEKFKRNLVRELDEGCHFVPVIGQEVSQRAGVITPEHHFPYLIYTLWRCKSADQPGTRWDIHGKGFPPYPSTEKLNCALKWLKDICETPDLLPLKEEFWRIANAGLYQRQDPNYQEPEYPAPEEHEEWRERGDWMRALHYICRLPKEEVSSPRSDLVLSARLDRWDRSLLDAYNIFSARGARPSNAHQMLAYLARILSIRTVLSTNPDTLIADAFQHIKWPLRAFEVEGRAPLPGTEQVRAQDSIVTLNFRATDEPEFENVAETLEEDDKSRFFRYLFPGAPAEDEEAKEDYLTPPGRLLIIGLRPRYRRIRALIRSVLERAVKAAADTHVGLALKIVRALRNELGTYDGNFFRVERRVIDEFFAKSEPFLNDISDQEVREALQKDLNNFRDKLNAFNLIGLEKIEKRVVELIDPESESAYRREVIRKSVEKLVKEFRDNLRTDDKRRFNAEVLRSHEPKRFFNSYVWPGFLAKIFLATMTCLRKEGKALDWSLANFKIFWILSKPSDRSEIEAYFNPLFQHSKELELDDVFQLAETTRPDILLYELYQEATLCLPPGGVTYQFIHLVPPDPVPVTDEDRYRLFDLFQEQLFSAIAKPKPKTEDLPRDRTIARTPAFHIQELDHSDSIKGRLMVCYGGRGVSSGASLVFRKLRREKDSPWEPVWFELADYSDPAGVYHHVLTAISYRLGRIQKEHVSFAFSPRKEADREEEVLISLRKILQTDSRRWVVFLFGRNLPGANSGWGESRGWDQVAYCKFYEVLRQFQELGLTLVYFPLRAHKAASFTSLLDLKGPPAEADGIIRADEEDRDRLDWKEAPTRDPEQPDDLWWPMQRHSSKRLFGRLCEWIEKGRIENSDPSYDQTDEKPHERARFLFALSLMRHSRHFSVLSSEAMYPCPNRFQESLGDDNDIARSVRVKHWLGTLCDDIGILRRKHGGFAWMHWSLRVYVQKCLVRGLKPTGEPLAGMQPNEEKRPKNWIDGRDFGGYTARTHHWLAEWYFKAFLSSRHPLPLGECIFHHLQAVLTVPLAKVPGHVEVGALRRKIEEGYRAQLIRKSLLEIATTLKLALPSIRFWMDEEVGRMFERVDGESGDFTCLTDGIHCLAEASSDDPDKLLTLAEFCKGTLEGGEVAELGKLLRLADAAPICELIRRQCSTIFRILRDESGSRLYYARDLEDEVRHHVDLQVGQDFQVIDFESSPTNEVDMCQIAGRLIRDLGMSLNQALAFIGSLETVEAQRELLLSVIPIRHARDEEGGGDFSLEDEETELSEILFACQDQEKDEGFNDLEDWLVAHLGVSQEDAEKARKSLLQHNRDYCHTALGMWLTHCESDSPDCEAEKREALVDRLEEVEGLIRKLRESVAGREEVRLRREIRNLVGVLPESLRVVEPLPIRRREEVREAVSLISSCAHLKAREAHFLNSKMDARFRRDGDSPNTEGDMRELEKDDQDLEARVYRHWAHVCELCSCVIRLNRMLFPAQSDLQMRETIAVRSLYAQALAHLRRFSEAHRKLDEAFAYLFNSRYATYDAQWGILELRRAEIYLHEALEGFTNLRGLVSTFRRRIAKLDDGFSSILRAERWLGGHNRSNWWWGRLLTTKVRTLAAVQELRKSRSQLEAIKPGKIVALSRRARIDESRQFADILDHALLLTPEDLLRTGRIVSYIGRVSYWRTEEEPDSQAWEELLERCRKLVKSMGANSQADLALGGYLELLGQEKWVVARAE